MDDIIKDIKDTYNSLWRTKVRGNSIEIITPVATSNNIFVSVFLTKRGNEYIVTDGGWIFNEYYETAIDMESIEYNRLFVYYQENYNVKKAVGNGVECYYKKTDKAILVPNIVYDLSSFISSVVSATFVEFKDPKEQEEQKRFTSEAKSYLNAIVRNKDVHYNSYIHDSIKSVKFSAVINKPENRLILVNFITGANTANFINSACKSNTNFEIADSSPISDYVSCKISIVNNHAAGYSESKIARYIMLLEAKHKTKPVNWSEKEKIKELI